ncbi:hypothetical protein SAMN04489806_1110 [Paramicrobacterium humi]|uniref:Uncharacterized protein n=1 Tax=Paramicrobacterium humi TaxID=640635 RepID=A0A1H4KE02_9MICO|nr:hypothetical protein [Microbacterium humi]SEB56172.1 hypothetical protein SAMN04489806_1110 [Microbacterium humi]
MAQHDDPLDGLMPEDDSYRTCPVCGRDCAPEVIDTGSSVRVAFSCPEHGAHSMVDPFTEEL